MRRGTGCELNAAARLRYNPHMRFAMLVSLLFVVACDDATESAGGACSAGSSVPIAAVEKWQLTESDSDPFPNRPAGMTCTDHGWGLDDGGVFGVYTGECDYVTVTQPLLVDLSDCNEIALELTHDRLIAPEGEASAVVALAIANEIVWTETFPIPAPPIYRQIRIPIEKPVAARTPIQFHVRNHGSNGWRLLSINRVLAGE